MNDDDDTNTLREWINDCAAGEKVDRVLIDSEWTDSCTGSMSDVDWSCLKNIPPETHLPMDDPRIQEALDTKFSSEFGSEQVPPTYVWTTHHVLFVHEYDGSTTMNSVPRHPAAITPNYM